MKAIILVGGYGTRLRPLTLKTPKALLPVHNKPFIYYQLDLLQSAGVKEVAFASGHLSSRLKQVVPKLGFRKMKFYFPIEKNPLGTGGAIRFAYDHLKSKTLKSTEPIFVFNGDVFLDIPLNKFLKYHQKHKSECSIALTKVPDGTPFGVVRTKSNGQVKKFIEKSKKNKGIQWINGGAYIFDPHLIEEIPKGKRVSVERDSFPVFLKRNHRIFGYKFVGYWNDIGTPATYLQAHIDLAQQKNRWTPKGLFRKREVFEGFGVKIGQNCELENCILMDHVKLGTGVKVKGAIIGKNSRIGDYSTINAGTVIGENSNITEYSNC